MTLLLTVIAFVFIVGLCIGSFLNVVILRSLEGESIVSPPSKCPSCGHALKWYHNIPLFSYIFLRGKCAFCKEHISLQYPIIELLTGILFCLIFIAGGISVNTLVMMIVVSLLIVIAGTDLKGKVVFDVHTLSLVGVCLIYSVYATANILYLAHVRPEYITLNKDTIIFLPVVSSILGCLAGIVIMEILARFGSIVKKGTRMFEVGDTYIAAGLGALFGWQMIVPVILLSIVVQVVLFLPIFIRDLFLRKETKTLVALLSFIAYAIIFFALEQTGIITVDKLIVYIPAVLVLALLGIYSCVRIITNLKENPSSGTCMPFGPAMVAAAFLTFILTAFI